MPTSFKLIMFAATSAGIAYASRASLRGFRFHGFYRFFAWESILALALLNIDQWFYQPFSLPQIISWMCLGISLCLLIYSVRLLSTIGKPSDKRQDASLFGIEKTTTLVTEGIYKYIRHPLYSSLFFLTWGVFFKSPFWASGGLALLATAFLTATAKVEEIENIRYFGLPYKKYIKQTRMFVPFLF